MSVAARARRLDEQAEIVVLERGEFVSFASCGLPYYVGGEIETASSLLVQTPQSLRAALNLDVRTRHEVTGVDTAARTVSVHSAHGSQALGYDALVLAPGAAAVRPPIPGLDSARVHTLSTIEDAMALRTLVADGVGRAVVLGAGFIGLEVAEALARQGVRVDVVELAGHVLPMLEEELATLVEEELHRLGITVHTGSRATEIIPTTDHDTVALADGTRVAADLIVLSVGVRPDTAFVEAAGIACERGAIIVDEHGRTSAPGVWAVGDATVSTDAVTALARPVPLAGPANRAGRLVADDILRPGSARPLPPLVGTAIVRVGDVTAAMTGANRTTLTAARTGFRTIHLHPNQHAGYFPGARPVHLILHFGEGDGLLLGAQAVGTEGVDKRIDVLATAIRARMYVADLIDLDLAYSPPYGQAKDPVNLAGMVGANVLDGTLDLWYAQDLDKVIDTALVLDTRSPAEYGAGHLPGSLNIPHTQLRERLDEVRTAASGRPVRVLCASGLRSAIAHRVLVQAGFDSASLSGGLLTLRAVLGHCADEVLADEGAPQHAASAAGHLPQPARNALGRPEARRRIDVGPKE
jgi:NADPH-dependent 2,4-dienoyl-CoA reductase/sulfur reductase-like enzyme/rhodanese-related sulfurtransferase